MEKTQTPTGTQLWKMVDPYTYRDRLAKPKMLINGTNDRYWTLDALDLYWGGLKGPKYLVELPNAGHGLDQNRDWAINGLGAFFRHVTTNRPMPRLSWSFDPDKDGKATVTVTATPEPRSARLWMARSASRDFRESKWESMALGQLPADPAPAPAPAPAPGPGGVGVENTTVRSFIVSFPLPVDGREAVFAELEFEVDGLPYHLTTTFFEPGIAPHKEAE
jgi:PhoPQ-activated pathogenicity-related protein